MKLPRLQVQIGAHAAKLDGKRLCHQGNACCDYRFGGRKAVSLDENLKSAFHQKQTLSDSGQLSLTVSMISDSVDGPKVDLVALRLSSIVFL